MLDFDLSKMAVIGTVALVVIGPEKLPRVARTMGTLLGRAQRYMKDVTAEVERQIQVDDLRALRDEIKDGIEQEITGARDAVTRGVQAQAAALQGEVDAAAASVREALPDYLPSVHEAGGDVQSELFATRPAPAQPAFINAAPAGQPPARAAGTKRGWRGAAAVARPAASIKRSRIVSVAASRSLGRS
jgi:sec-independent protein translocase protein TatB